MLVVVAVLLWFHPHRVVLLWFHAPLVLSPFASAPLVASAFTLSLTNQLKGAEVDVKRLPKRPAPPAFGRKLTEAQKLELLTFALIVDTYTPYISPSSINLYCMVQQ